MSAGFLQGLRKRLRCWVALVTRLGQGACQHGIEGGWQFGVEVAGRSRLVRDDLLNHHEVRLALKRALACQQLVQHDASRKQISARVDRAALNLLWRHVFQGADHRALGTGGLTRVLNTGHPEVGQLDTPIRFHQQVGRLDVAVNNALLVRILKCRKQALHDAQGLRQRVDVAPVEVAFQVVTLYELHHQVGDVQVAVRVIHTDNIGVLQACCRACLGAKTYFVFVSFFLCEVFHPNGLDSHTAV